MASTILLKNGTSISATFVGYEVYELSEDISSLLTQDNLSELSITHTTDNESKSYTLHNCRAYFSTTDTGYKLILSEQKKSDKSSMELDFVDNDGTISQSTYARMKRNFYSGLLVLVKRQASDPGYPLCSLYEYNGTSYIWWLQGDGTIVRGSASLATSSSYQFTFDTTSLTLSDDDRGSDDSGSDVSEYFLDVSAVVAAEAEGLKGITVDESKVADAYYRHVNTAEQVLLIGQNGTEGYTTLFILNEDNLEEFQESYYYIEYNESGEENGVYVVQLVNHPTFGTCSRAVTDLSSLSLECVIREIKLSDVLTQGSVTISSETVDGLVDAYNSGQDVYIGEDYEGDVSQVVNLFTGQESEDYATVTILQCRRYDGIIQTAYLGKLDSSYDLLGGYPYDRTLPVIVSAPYNLAKQDDIEYLSGYDSLTVIDAIDHNVYTNGTMATVGCPDSMRIYPENTLFTKQVTYGSDNQVAYATCYFNYTNLPIIKYFNNYTSFENCCIVWKDGYIEEAIRDYTNINCDDDPLPPEDIEAIEYYVCRGTSVFVTYDEEAALITKITRSESESGIVYEARIRLSDGRGGTVIFSYSDGGWSSTSELDI